MFCYKVVNSKNKKMRKYNDGVNIRHSIKFFYRQSLRECKALEIVCLLIAYSYFRCSFFLLREQNSLNCQEPVRKIKTRWDRILQHLKMQKKKKRARELQSRSFIIHEKKVYLFFFSIIFNCSLNNFNLFVWSVLKLSC